MSAPVAPPMGLVAELTHRCPLACLYCSNPLQLTPARNELSSEEWTNLLQEARRLGAMQLHLTGGEPLLRDDLELIATNAANAGFYVNLITSGIGLTADRAAKLAGSGVNNVQLSLQSDNECDAVAICGRPSVEPKLKSAKFLVDAGLPLAWNIVLHSLNLERMEKMVELCASFNPHRIELAHVQYHGRALVDRQRLLPSREDIRKAEVTLQELRTRYEPNIELLYVKPDWFEDYPKPCNGGWAKLQITVTPDGVVLPCTSAASIQRLQFHNIKEKGLHYIWYESSAFNAFRGFDWMSEPCFSCPRREQDFGGCRCQSFALTGDASRTDPACSLSADHSTLQDLMATTLQ